MIMQRAIKYRIYPNKKQMEQLKQTFGCCRKIWNLMLNDWISSYKETGKTTYTSPASYKDEYSYLKNVDSLALANEYLNLKKAFKSFFEKRNKFPKFKSAKRDKSSYTTYNQHGTVRILSDTNQIHLPKIGDIEVKLHRLPKQDWRLKNATISMTNDGKFFVSILFEFDFEQPILELDKNNSIGLDYKSDGLCVDSSGVVYGVHKYFRESQALLAEYQQTITHKVKGSSNYNHLKNRITKLYRHIANQRKDFLHKLSTEIANLYDIVCVEDLNLAAISQSLKLGKSTMDNGYGMFIQMLTYKLFERGKKIVKVNKYFPSTQICSHCGNKQKLTLNERTFHCLVCGFEINRDENAAINIRNEGINSVVV